MSVVRANTNVYAATHVAANLMRGIKQIIRESGLDLTKLRSQWEVIENGAAVWLRSGELEALVLEVWDPGILVGNDLVGRFDFVIDYGYYADGDGELWLDPDMVSYTIRKNGGLPSRCVYRVIADTTPNATPIPGWTTTRFRSISGFTRHSAGTAIGGGELGAALVYYRRTSAQ
jgi:hypothetical protein